LQRALRDFSANAMDDFGLGLAGFPRGPFPFAHLGDADDRKWHGASVAKFQAGAKAESGSSAFSIKTSGGPAVIHFPVKDEGE
jgi:hypothetical protein